MKKDCFAYTITAKGRYCKALKEMYCNKGECAFYKTNIQAEAEKLISKRRLKALGYENNN